MGYEWWNEYWKETISDMYGSAALDMLPPELDGYSKDLENVKDTE
jgi:hypothetical protein